jgi:(p)ppGpp synthase/HD superfamily hydrolase
MNLFWSQTMDAQALFDVPVTLTVTDEREALAAVATELARAGSSIIGASIHDDTKHANEQIITLTIRVRNRAHLHQIARSLLAVPSVVEVIRQLDGERTFKLQSD